MKRFPIYRQLDSMDCGPACLRMIAQHYGKRISLPYLREKSYIDREGVSVKGIAEAAEHIGFRTLAVKLPFENQGEQVGLTEAPLPLIAHWNQKHFVVVYHIAGNKVWLADPAQGKVRMSIEAFKAGFCSDGDRGVALLLEATPLFYQTDAAQQTPKGFGFLLQYLHPHRRLMIQLLIGLLLSTVFQLAFPFLTQSLVDIGIDTQNLPFIYIVLAGQLMLFFSQTLVRFIQSWILLHISVRINVSLIADFLIKLMLLPIRFFDAKNIGDLLQRINDHRRIEVFLTQNILTITLATLNLVVFGIVLLIYSVPIFLIFLGASILYIIWIFLFMPRRREVDHRLFQLMSENQTTLIEIIQGMPEIKLQGSQLKRRWQWAGVQARLFRAQVRSLSISQYQDAGALSISQLKDIFITFLAAKLVLDGQITLGMMLAIQYIIGQLNAPLQQLIGFFRAAQDASLSLERMSEIHDAENEENPEEQKLDIVPDGDLVLEQVSFQYTPIADQVLKDIDIRIPRGKTTAIVGASGSGKTTLIKLLLGFYNPSKGRIFVGHTHLENIEQRVWRAACGVVMQDGYIFSDTIANNIAESDDRVDFHRVISAAHTAHIFDFVQSLPLGLNTMIGAKGNGISQGQRQRLLIARAVYKNPEFLFLDEATNALDANNEKVIVENLGRFLANKTAVVVAHRLSTVKNADQIVVLDRGRVVETGTHQELVAKKGHYFALVQNQLELGN
ncbi:MAG TPA: peptidase domain-containing ABC transporter [Saprospiraceae bacterium]|nr:peptidase domain-containing ABC transporter [Saprospiraceae bacterium]HMQ85471.1 peptidase domain-containing ABC transporter [Saprospiraceae bacterium]